MTQDKLNVRLTLGIILIALACIVNAIAIWSVARSIQSKKAEFKPPTEFKPPIGNICISYTDNKGEETQPICYPEIKVYGTTGYRIWVTPPDGTTGYRTWITPSDSVPCVACVLCGECQ
jgi:hypothetical protein